jgi:hypothetical protein
MDVLTAVVTTFLIPMGNNSIINDSIINNTQPNYYIDCNSDTKLNNEYSNLYTELFSYRELQDNWDGYKGVKPSDEIISTTERFIDILKCNKILKPKIMVSGNGEIGLFWKNQDKYIEIDFDEAEYLSFFYKMNGTVYGEDDVTINHIPEKLYNAFNSLITNSSTKSENASIISNFDSTNPTIFLT